MPRSASGTCDASCSLKGPLDQLGQRRRAWWLTGVQWGPSIIGDARGDFELTPDHFQAKAKSDDSQFPLQHGSELFPMDQRDAGPPGTVSAERRVRSTADGHLARATRQIRGTFDASDIAFPDDLPFLSGSASLKGLADAHGRVAGTLDEPLMKGTLTASDLHTESETIGQAAASFTWTPTRLDVPAFHIAGFIDGRYRRETADLPRWAPILELRQRP